MSLRRFDDLVKAQEVKRAKECLAEYEAASRREDLNEQDRNWLRGAVEKAREWVARAERQKMEWWS